jgi:hypothetical protein
MEIIKETDKYVEYRTGWGASRTTRETKFPCFGGPFDGEMRTRRQLGDAAASATYNNSEGYHEFNRRSQAPFRVVFVWISADRIPTPTRKIRRR